MTGGQGTKLEVATSLLAEAAVESCVPEPLSEISATRLIHPSHHQGQFRF